MTCQQRYPGPTFAPVTPPALPWPDGHFDVVFQSTVFTSILDPEYEAGGRPRNAACAEAAGCNLWYDFHVNNPRNPNVRGVGRARRSSAVSRLPRPCCGARPWLRRWRDGWCRFPGLRPTCSKRLRILNTTLLRRAAETRVTRNDCLRRRGAAEFREDGPDSGRARVRSPSGAAPGADPYRPALRRSR